MTLKWLFTHYTSGLWKEPPTRQKGAGNVGRVP